MYVVKPFFKVHGSEKDKSQNKKAKAAGGGITGNFTLRLGGESSGVYFAS